MRIHLSVKHRWSLFFLLLPNAVFASTSSDQITPILNGVIQLLSSGIARLIFVLAIVGVGYGWLYLGRLPKERAIAAIVGIGIVFSATWIAQQLGVGGV